MACEKSGRIMGFFNYNYVFLEIIEILQVLSAAMNLGSSNVYSLFCIKFHIWDPKILRQRFEKDPVSKMMEKVNSQCSWDLWKLFGLPHSWSSLILSSIWLMFSLVAPGVKDSLVTFSFSSWNMFLSPCFASILMLKILPCRMPCGRCIQSQGLPLAPWLPVQWDWSGSYRRWWVFLIMNFGPSDMMLNVHKIEPFEGNQPSSWDVL